MSNHRIHTEFDWIEVKDEAGAALLRDLEAERYGGATTTIIREQLWLYGWVNLQARLGDGGIAALGSGPGAREVTAQHVDQFALQSTRDELAIATLEEAVPKFVINLEKGRYDPFKGTTVATFFLNFTFRRFRTVVHPKWADDLARRQYELGQIRPGEEWYSTELIVPDHAGEVVSYLATYRAAVQAVKRAPVDQRAVVLGVLRGKTHLEIAAELGITPNAVQHRLATFRKRAWYYRPDTGEVDEWDPAA